MSKEPHPQCASCETKACREGKDCFDAGQRHLQTCRDENVARFHRAASAIEARHYSKAPRLQETILFAKELGCRKIGIAFCIGLADEARTIERILAQHFEVLSVCCKVSGISKERLALEQIRPEAAEVTCNPAGQADLLNRAGSELNILCGLCVGHDALFTMHSKAPVTTLIAKDRVLAHNPIGAVYCSYVRRKVESPVEPKEKAPQT